MMDTSPGATSSCSSPASMDGYQTLPTNRIIEGRTIRLVPLHISHKDGLWQQMNDVENAKLFRHTYGTTCASKHDLWDAITGHGRIYEDSLTLTILDKKTKQPIGWTVLRSTPNTGAVHCALFLPRLSRSERGTEAIHYIGCLVFNELELERLEFRAGKLDESSGPRGGPMGITLIGVLSRQLRDDLQSRESDLYVLTRQKWPYVYVAVKAWLDAKEVCETGSTRGSSPALVGFGVI